MPKTGKKYNFHDLVDVKSIEKGLAELEKQFKDLDKSIKATSKIKPDEISGAELKKILEEMKKMEALRKERLATEKKLREARKKAREQEKENLRQAKETAKVEKEAARRLERIRKQKEKNKVTDQQVNNALKKVVKTENERIKVNAILTKRLKNVNQTSKEGREEYAKLNAVIAKNNKLLRDAGNARNDDRRNVGNYTSALGKMRAGITNAVGSIAGGLGLAGGVMALTSVMKSAINVSLKFDKALSRLKAISGGSKEEMALLAEQAKKLGAETAFTANQILELDTELAKLGFTAKQIENAVPGIQSLASATGTDLAESATLAGSSLNIFKLNASEAGRVADVLALSTTKSALDMQKLGDALPYVGTGARLAGKDIEFTTAQLGTLADNGLSASVSGTSLRKIFTELSKKGLTYEEALQQINESTDKSKTAFNLFGATAKDAAVILAENIDKTAKLETTLRGAKGEAEKMSKVMLDNLAGDITIAGSAWEGFVLSLEDGEGQFSKISRGLVQFGTEMLGSLTKGNELTETIKTIFSEFSGLFEIVKKVINIFRSANSEITAVDIIFKTLNTTLTIATTPLRAIIWLFTKLLEGFIFVKEGFERGIDVIYDFATSFDFLNIAIDFAIGKFNMFKGAITSLLETLGILDEEQKKSTKSAKELAKEKEIAAYFSKKRKEDAEAEAEAERKNAKALRETTLAIKDKNKIKVEAEKEVSEADKIKAEQEAEFKKFQELQKIQSANYEFQKLQFEKSLIDKNLSEEESSKVSKEIALAELDFKILQLQKYAEFVKQNNKDLSEEELQNLENSILAIQIQREKLALPTARKGGGEGGEKGKDKPDSLGGLIGQSLGLDPETTDLLIEQADKLYSELENLANTYFEAERMRNEELLQDSDDRISALQDELKEEEEKNKQGIANNSDRVKAEIALEKKKNDELLAEKKKLAEREKKIAIGKVAISTAIAVTNALLQLPSPKAWIDAAGAAVVGALQIATISKQKFRKGGSGILQGASHEMGGITFDGNKEAEGGESFGILSKSATKKHSKLFDSIVSGLNSDNLDFLSNNNLILNNDNSQLVKGQEIANKHLKQIAERPDRGFDKNGNLKTEVKDNHIIIHNV